MFCKTCGTQIPEGSTFCPGCGAAAEVQPVQQYHQVQPAHVPQTRINPGFMILSICAPACGIAMGIVHLCKKNTRPGRAYLIAGIIGDVLSIALLIANVALFYAFAKAVSHP